MNIINILIQIDKNVATTWSPMYSHKMQWMAKEDKQDTPSNLCQPRREPS